jgi:hypothetical protein
MHQRLFAVRLHVGVQDQTVTDLCNVLSHFDGVPGVDLLRLEDTGLGRTDVHGHFVRLNHDQHRIGLDVVADV